MKILVSGGSGFVGSHLIKALKVDNKKEILNIDKKESPWHQENSRIINVTNHEKVQSLDFKADVIIHLAAEHRDDVRPESLYYDVNVKGTENIIQYANNNKINTIIFFSTVAVYGFAKIDTNEDGNISPFNEYGRSKWEAEKKLRSWYERSPSERKLVILRPTVIFGPRNRGNFFNLIDLIYRNKFLMVGKGMQKKSLAYIENIIDFVIYSLDFPTGQSYLFNYVDKPESSMNDIITTIHKTLGKVVPKIRVPYFFAILGAFFFDILAIALNRTFPISRIRIKKFCSNTSFETAIKATTFQARYTLDEAIRKTVKYEFIDPKEDNTVFYTE